MDCATPVAAFGAVTVVTRHSGDGAVTVVTRHSRNGAFTVVTRHSGDGAVTVRDVAGTGLRVTGDGAVATLSGLTCDQQRI